ncbi:MAG: HAMP domain-containing histidine kinase [Deltaproteobacteria bacterium]|nr:HAMP domain-containing histidine kinase [Deltaproteobacteria bacterium]
MPEAIRFSLRTKLICGILIPAALLLVVSYLDQANLAALGRAAGNILSQNYRTIKATYQINRLLRDRQDQALAALAGGPAARPPAPDQDRRLDELVAVCRRNLTEEGEEAIVAHLEELVPAYQKAYAALARAWSAGPAPAPRAWQDLAGQADRLGALLDRLVAINEKAMEKADQDTRSLAGTARGYSLTLLAAVFLMVVAFSLVYSRQLSRPLTALAQSLAAVRQQEREYPHFPVESRDEIGLVTAEFNRLVDRLREYDRLSLAKLSAARAKVAAAQEAKARFMADLSHQLKTPLTSLTMAVGILAARAQGRVEEKYQRLLDTAVDDCARLSALINELLDLSRLDDLAKPRPKELLEVGDMIHKCLKPLCLQAEEKGVELAISFEDRLPPAPMDSFRFPWVITNLVGNALRYTPAGGRVSLAVARSGGRLVFQCQDTGVGMDPAYLPHIFDRYAQFSEREAQGAIGLGLAIVKEIIEEHRGDISVESRPGQGTGFTFWIPLGEGTGHGPGADS